MAKRGKVITKTFEYKGKTVIIQTDSVEYMESEGRKYSEDNSKEEDAS
jgi:hypothetical protein